MADFNFVTDRVATGAAINNEDDVQQLVNAGVTVVVDCRGEFDDAPLFTAHPAITYVYDGTADDGQTKPPEWFRRGITVALLKLASPNEKVYAHCAAGVNRGPSMCYAILRAQGLNAVEAESLIRVARPQVGLRYKGDADVAIKVLGYE